MQCGVLGIGAVREDVRVYPIEKSVKVGTVAGSYLSEGAPS